MNLGSFSRRTLLTGAGFSKNYRCLLASEFLSQLLVHPEVSTSLQRELKADRQFEVTLARARRGELSASDSVALQTAVRALFVQMDEAVQNPDYRRDPLFDHYQLQEFLRRFRGGLTCDTTYWFTLNQDLVLERRTYNWATVPFYCFPPRHPGVPAPPASVSGGQHYFSTSMRQFDDSYVSTVPNHIEDKKLAGFSNYVKLHGSFNWVDQERKNLMVIGGEKEDQIRASDLFSWYFQIFESVLQAGGVKLFIIGYSLRDPHVNAIIEKAIKTADLEIYMVDPDPFARLDEVKSKAIYDATIPLQYGSLGELMPASQARSNNWSSICDRFFGA